MYTITRPNTINPQDLESYIHSKTPGVGSGVQRPQPPLGMVADICIILGAKEGVCYQAAMLKITVNCQVTYSDLASLHAGKTQVL